jgi:hypothetical protein
MMVNYNAIQNSSLGNLHFFTLYKKADKPIKSLIRHFPCNISAENITVALQEIHYDLISVRQVTAYLPTREGRANTPSPLYS